MTVAIHQPNYLPWLGYFYKIAHSDCFVFLDDVEFTKSSFTRRVHIRKGKLSQEKAYLIVPLKKHSDYALINELEIDHSQNWQRRQLNQIMNTYAAAPSFDLIYPLFEKWMEKSIEFFSLSLWNQYIIQEIAQLLCINTSFLTASKLNIDYQKPSRNLTILQHLGASTYLSGQGARKYQLESNFQEANIILRYSRFKNEPYWQAQGDWLGGLSVLDGLMNGVNGLGNILF